MVTAIVSPEDVAATVGTRTTRQTSLRTRGAPRSRYLAVASAGGVVNDTAPEASAVASATGSQRSRAAHLEVDGLTGDRGPVRGGDRAAERHRLAGRRAVVVPATVTAAGTGGGGVGVAVGVGVGSTVGVAVGGALDVGVLVGAVVGAFVGVRVGVAVGVGVGVGVFVGVVVGAAGGLGVPVGGDGECRGAASGVRSASGAGAPSTSWTARWTGSGRWFVYAAAATPLDRPTATTIAVPPVPSRRTPRRSGLTLPREVRAARNAATYRSSPASSLGVPGARRARTRSSSPAVSRQARSSLTTSYGSDPRVAGQRPERPVHRDAHRARLLADQVGHLLHVQSGDDAEHHHLGLGRRQRADQVQRPRRGIPLDDVLLGAGRRPGARPPRPGRRPGPPAARPRPEPASTARCRAT